MSPVLATSIPFLLGAWRLDIATDPTGAPAATAALIEQVAADLASSGVDVAAELAVAA